MANTLTQIGIETGNTVEAYHVSQSIDAFTGAVAYDITLSGSFNMTGPINGQPGLINPLTASYAISASRAISASFVTSASYAVSASFVTSASYAVSASRAVSASFVTSASYALSSSYALNSLSSSFSQTASYVNPLRQDVLITGSLKVTGSITGSSLLVTGSSSSALVKIIQVGSGNAFTVEDAANDASPFVVDSNGQVGIGKTTPTTRLDVSGSSNFVGPVTINLGTTASNTQGLNATNSEGKGFYTIPSIGGAFNYVTLSTAGDTAIIGSTGENFIIGAGNGAAWKFLGNSGAGNDGKMYTVANVGISVNDPTYLIHLGSDSANKPGTNVWDTTSDQRLKENIEEANYDTCYDIIKNLPLKRYTWKDDVYTTEQVKDRSKLGWIAQDVEIVFPKAVNTNPFSGSGDFYIEDCKSLNADQIYATLYGTVKKLIQENETLKSELQGIKTHLGI